MIEAYGSSDELRAIANLAIFAGIRKDIGEMAENERQVLTDILLAMDRYDLYGKIALPKNHDSQFDVPELYRLAATSGGVFVNSAYIELFGLTAIEASAVGLPFVATTEGGPQDIVANCRSGLLVDVTDRGQLTDAIKELLVDRKKWQELSKNGIELVPKSYRWETHCRRYVAQIKPLLRSEGGEISTTSSYLPGRRLASLEYLLISDIDNTPTGDDAALEDLLGLLDRHKSRVGFGLASGRDPEQISEFLREAGIKKLDVMIASVGSEIFYGESLGSDKGWSTRLRRRWYPDRIKDVLQEVSFLQQQSDRSSHRHFKISYDISGDIEQVEALAFLREKLSQTGSTFNVIISHGRHVDVLPPRASKGRAIRYLSNKWQIPLTRIITAGDSGNDRDMLSGATSGIVVGNHDPELDVLRYARGSRVYFAVAKNAAGIIEGLRHYGAIPTEE